MGVDLVIHHVCDHHDGKLSNSIIVLPGWRETRQRAPQHSTILHDVCAAWLILFCPSHSRRVLSSSGDGLVGGNTTMDIRERLYPR